MRAALLGVLAIQLATNAATPIVQWAQVIGGPGADLAGDLAFGPNGQVYLVGDIDQKVPPVKMFHCQSDPLVVFANAEVAYQSFTNRGACCVSLVDPGALPPFDHDGCWAPSLQGVLAWFETLRQ